MTEWATSDFSDSNWELTEDTIQSYLMEPSSDVTTDEDMYRDINSKCDESVSNTANQRDFPVIDQWSPDIYNSQNSNATNTNSNINDAKTHDQTTGWEHGSDNWPDAAKPIALHYHTTNQSEAVPNFSNTETTGDWYSLRPWSKQQEQEDLDAAIQLSLMELSYPVNDNASNANWLYGNSASNSNSKNGSALKPAVNSETGWEDYNLFLENEPKPSTSKVSELIQMIKSQNLSEQETKNAVTNGDITCLPLDQRNSTRTFTEIPCDEVQDCLANLIGQVVIGGCSMKLKSSLKALNTETDLAKKSFERYFPSQLKNGADSKKRELENKTESDDDKLLPKKSKFDFSNSSCFCTNFEVDSVLRCCGFGCYSFYHQSCLKLINLTNDSDYHNCESVWYCDKCVYLMELEGLTQAKSTVVTSDKDDTM